MGVADAQASAQNAYAVIHHAEVVPSFAMPSTLALGPMAWSAVGRGARPARGLDPPRPAGL